MASYAYPSITKSGTGGASTTPLDLASTAYSNLSSVYPNLGAAQNQASSNILGQLKGELSPETLNAIQDQSARFGVLSGIPGSGVAQSQGRKLLGTSVENLQGQGLQNYLNSLKTYSGTLAPTPSDTLGKYGIDTSAATSAAQLGQQAYQFGQQFPESQRQFDISHALQNSQFGAGLNQSYLNSYLNLLG